jgi:hypothetical protein
MQRMVPLAAFVSAAVLALAPTPASAGSVPVQVADGPPLALFEGNLIDLTQGWGEAQACMVWSGGVECFRSAEEMSQREAEIQGGGGTLAPASTASMSVSCSSPLRLYEHTWYGGRELSFWDPGFWQNLGDYGFNDRTSSYKIGACYAHLAEHAWGGGWWYPGDTSPYHWEPYMISGWNDRVSSIYNE